MELRVLKYFLAVARTGNITMAATQMHVGQPTLSRQLRELEEELGQELFVRQPHGVALTKEGERLRTYAMQLVSISDKIEEEFAALRANPMGDVYLGGIEGARFHRVARLFKLARERYPEITLHYHAGSYHEVSVMLDRGILDLGLVYCTIKNCRFEHKYELLELPYKERWVAYMRSDNPLAQNDVITAKDLVDEPLLMYDQIMHMPREMNGLAAWFGEDFDRLSIAGTSNLTYANSVMVQEGMGTLITWEGLTGIGAEEDMVVRPLHPTVDIQIALVWCKERPLSPAAEYLLELLRKQMAD